MNNTSPLIPQGATAPRPKSSLYFKVLMVLSVHVVVLGGMLLQGCKDTGTTAKTDSATPSATDATATTTPNTTTMPAPAPTDVPPTLNPSISNTYVSTATTPAPAPAPVAAPSSAAVVPKPVSTDLAPPAAPGEAKEYVIAKGDTLGAIAHKNGLSVKALMEANPNVNPKKLQVGQKVQIPAGAAAVTAMATPAAGAAAEAAPAEGGFYVVKSGDTLTKIAKTHGTTFKKIMAMNDLKTTSIHAGQKLKLPAPKTAAVEPAANSTAVAASATVTPAPAPIKVASAVPASSTTVAAN
jgi:LysM repeat protein